MMLGWRSAPILNAPALDFSRGSLPYLTTGGLRWSLHEISVVNLTAQVLVASDFTGSPNPKTSSLYTLEAFKRNETGFLAE
jgi:hypothetical protein